MTTVTDVLWSRLHIALMEFADKLVIMDPTLIRSLGHTENDVFLLRGYLALRRRADGDEVAITVDVQFDGHRLTVVSDVCADDGRIIATGPSIEVPLSDIQTKAEAVLNDWLCDFQRFLRENERVVAAAASQLL